MRLVLLFALCGVAFAGFGFEAEIKGSFVFARQNGVDLPVYEKDVVEGVVEEGNEDEKDWLKINPKRQKVLDTVDDSVKPDLCSRFFIDNLVGFKATLKKNDPLQKELSCDKPTKLADSKHPMFSGLNEFKTTLLKTVDDCDVAFAEYKEVFDGLKKLCKKPHQEAYHMSAMQVFTKKQVPLRLIEDQGWDKVPKDEGIWIKVVPCNSLFVDSSQLGVSPQFTFGVWSDVIVDALTSSTPKAKIVQQTMASYLHASSAVSTYFQTGPLKAAKGTRVEVFLTMMANYFPIIKASRVIWLEKENEEKLKLKQKSQNSKSQVTQKSQKSSLKTVVKEVKIPVKVGFRSKTVANKNSMKPRLHTSPCQVWQFLKAQLKSKFSIDIDNDKPQLFYPENAEEKELFAMMYGDDEEACDTLRPTDEVGFYKPARFDGDEFELVLEEPFFNTPQFTGMVAAGNCDYVNEANPTSVKDRLAAFGSTRVTKKL